MKLSWLRILLLGVFLAWSATPGFTQDDLDEGGFEDEEDSFDSDSAFDDEDADMDGEDDLPPEDVIDELTLDTSPALLEDGEFEAGRDPFEDIFVDTSDDGPRAEGLPGLGVREATLQGIMSGAFGNVALFLGRNKELYPARINQQFRDGVLVRIEAGKVVFEQEVIDDFGRKRPPVIVEVPLHASEQRRKR